METRALAAPPRFLGILAAWGLFVLGSPGVLSPDGSAALAVLGVGVWGSVALRPPAGRPWRAFLAHALGALPGAAGLMLWIRFVFWPPLLYIGLGMGIYSAAGALLARRLARRLPAPLAVALAWTGMETLRTAVPNPFGLGWLRLGYHAHGHLDLAGSARVWGVAGLTFVLASLGGLLAALAARWGGKGGRLGSAGWVAGLAPLALGVVLARATSAPDMVEGPRVLLIQPGFPQERKQRDDPGENFAALLDLTAQGLAAERERGAPEPDLVCWGETMLYVPLFEAGVRAAVDGRASGGLTGDPELPTLDWIDGWSRAEEEWVLGRLLGRGGPQRSGVVPRGTSFLSGAEVLLAVDGRIRRQNAVVLYGPDGRRSAPAAKQYLVPGAETMYGLERIGCVRRFIAGVSGYVPDYVADQRTGILELSARDGRTYRLGATVCYDNAHVPPYTDPVRDGGVDFHLVVSNEAWYRQSFEADQMVAFTRLHALASGRAIVRSTNSGISLVMGPDGRELARIRRDGGDREVRGTLALAVPVPPEGAGDAPPFVRLRRGLQAAWIALPLLLLWVLRRRGGNPRAAGA